MADRDTDSTIDQALLELTQRRIEIDHLKRVIRELALELEDARRTVGYQRQTLTTLRQQQHRAAESFHQLEQWVTRRMRGVEGHAGLDPTRPTAELGAIETPNQAGSQAPAASDLQQDAP